MIKAYKKKRLKEKTPKKPVKEFKVDFNSQDIGELDSPEVARYIKLHRKEK